MPDRNNTSRTNRTRQCRQKASRRENALRAPATPGHGQRIQRQSAPSRKKRRGRHSKGQYHTISVPKPLFRCPTPAFLPQIHLMATPPRNMLKHFSCYSQKHLFSRDTHRVFGTHKQNAGNTMCSRAVIGQGARRARRLRRTGPGCHAFQTPRSASRHSASCTLW